VTGIAQPMIAEHRADTSWHHQGACRDEDDTLFFHPEGERGATRRRRAEAAKSICRMCPVMNLCQADSIARREPHGTWGGLSEDERARVLAGRPLPQVLPTTTTRPRHIAQLVRTGPDIPHEIRGGRVSTEHVQAHVRHLVEAGYGIPEIAKAADVMAESVRRVAHGGQTATQRTVRLLLAVHPEAQEVAA